MAKYGTIRPAARRKNFRSTFVGAYDKFLEPTARTLVLSDVDGTIVRGSLVLDHALYLQRMGLCSFGASGDAWLHNPKGELEIFNFAEAYRRAIIGYKASELRIPEFIESVVSDPTKVYSTLERLKSHQTAGHQVVLISGSPIFLVRPFARRFGFDAVGSRYHRTKAHQLTGDVTLMAGAKAKQKALEKLDLPSYDTIIGYGDTASDAPLLGVANHSVLVDPNRETLQKLRELKISEILKK